MRNIVRQEAERLNPGGFAFVMATGIISIAAYRLGMEHVAKILFYINNVAYAVLIILTSIRTVLFPSGVKDDACGFAQGPAFFTIVAGTCVLGSQFVILSKNFTVGIVLCIFGLALWAVLIYAFFTAAVTGDRKPVLATDVDGGWLLYAVGTQAISILGTLIVPDVQQSLQDSVLLFSAAMHFLGSGLYLFTIILILYRLLFFPIEPENLTPLYWINMGAAAITTLAGASLMLNAERWVFLREVLPFLKGHTLFFWSVTTWWIPLLVMLNAWRHISKRFPIAYEPRYWGMVFPLGMYTACSLQLGRAARLPFLVGISRVFIYMALAAWLAAFIGLVHRLARIRFFRAV